MITFLTFFNTTIIVYFLLKQSRYSIEFKKISSQHKLTFIGFRLIVWEQISIGSYRSFCTVNFRFRNETKINEKEEIMRLIAMAEHNRKYTLNAKFSWLKTLDEVNHFEKTFTVVDRILVEKLVREWKQKNNFT